MTRIAGSIPSPATLETGEVDSGFVIFFPTPVSNRFVKDEKKGERPGHPITLLETQCLDLWNLKV